MGFLGLTHERELELDLTKEDFRTGLEFNVAKPTIGSFFTDMFSTDGHKYKGSVDSTTFSLTFPKSFFRPSLFYPVISGNFNETATGLKVNVKVSSINWLAKTLFIQLILAIAFVMFLITRIANDLTDMIVITTMLLVVLIPIYGIELYRMNKGARTAITEIEKDILRIATTYNSR